MHVPDEFDVRSAVHPAALRRWELETGIGAEEFESSGDPREDGVGV